VWWQQKMLLLLLLRKRLVVLVGEPQERFVRTRVTALVLLLVQLVIGLRTRTPGSAALRRYSMRAGRLRVPVRGGA
jgi:hypothetical protein